MILFIYSNINAQSDTDTLSNKKGVAINNLKFVPIPIVAANPTVGILYGLAFSSTAILGDPANTRMSTSSGTVNYSTNNQFLSLIKTNIYTSRDEWILLGDWRYFDSSQPTFGLGTGPESIKLVSNDSIEYEDGIFTKPVPESQMMAYKYIKLSEIVLRKVNKYFYLGIGLHLDYHFNIEDNLLNLDTTGGKRAAITSHYAYSKLHGYNYESYMLSGLSFNTVYDSRDNSANPYSGRYALISYRINPMMFGSDQNSSSLWLEYRDYFSVSKKRKRDLIAVWAYANMEITGKRPYMDLAAIGWDQFGRSGRAYVQGRFRGNSMIYSEVEYRKQLWGTKKNPELIGAVAFVNATTASNYDAGQKLYKYVNFGYGIGLRVMLIKASRINVTVDYAWGAYGAKGIFINANEAF